jgi:hypothetical protein
MLQENFSGSALVISRIVLFKREVHGALRSVKTKSITFILLYFFYSQWGNNLKQENRQESPRAPAIVDSSSTKVSTLPFMKCPSSLKARSRQS